MSIGDLAACVAALASIAGVVVVLIVDDRQAKRAAEAETRSVERDTHTRLMSSELARLAEERADQRAANAIAYEASRTAAQHNSAINAYSSYVDEAVGLIDRQVATAASMAGPNERNVRTTALRDGLFENYQQINAIVTPATFTPIAKVSAEKLVFLLGNPTLPDEAPPSVLVDMLQLLRTRLIQQMDMLGSQRIEDQ
jgi:hypothetical protein